MDGTGQTLNALGQPIGRALPGFQPPPRPPRVPLAGRWCRIEPLSAAVHGAAIRRAFAQRYEGERFIRVMPLSDPATLDGGFFDVMGANDSNRVDIFVFANDRQALLMARLDPQAHEGCDFRCLHRGEPTPEPSIH